MDSVKLSEYILAAAKEYGITLDLHDIQRSRSAPYYVVTLWVSNSPSKFVIDNKEHRINDVLAKAKIALHMQALSKRLA